MKNLKFNINAEEMASAFGDMKKTVEAALNKGIESLASMTHQKTIELANSKLKATRKIYNDNLSFEQIAPSLWVVSLAEPALWIEEGRKCVIFNDQSPKPKVLTPDGEICIKKLKPGMLVLNQFGKWTKVKAVHEEKINSKFKMSIFRIEKTNYNPEKKELHKRKNLLGFLCVCSTCGNTVSYKKINQKTQEKGVYCKKCTEQIEFVQIQLPGTINYKEKKQSQRLLNLTLDHKVMTQRGWIEAKDLLETDFLMVPSWKKCKVCGKSTYCYKDYCYTKTGASPCQTKEVQKKLLQQNKHVSQSSNWLSDVYIKTLRNLKKISGCEDAVAKLLTKNGFSVSFYSEEKMTDVYRQYPIKGFIDSLGRQKYYFADFYFPKLDLIIEVDGKGFHSSEEQIKKDKLRDKKINSTLNAKIIRIPAKKVNKKDFYEKTLRPIISNHSDDIEYIPLKIKVWRKKINNTSNYKKWDVEVENGESFVCNKVLIHNSGSMVDDLLRKNAKVSKNGNRYKSIPFEHSKPSSQQTPKQQEFVSLIKAALKARGLGIKKIEYNKDGSPRVGRLHKIDVPSPLPSSRASTPALFGLTIYQSINSRGSVRRDVMTFRTVSDKHKSQGKWIHPGRDADKFMDKAFDWAIKEWENVILPTILKDFE